MKMPNNSSRVRYAVIQLRESDGSMERFVIGYEDERSLRQFLAKPSIVATGFLSRNEATNKSFMAGVRNRLPFREYFHVRTLRAGMRSRLQNRPGTLRLMNSVVQIGLATLQEIRSRLTHARRQLEPAVQSQ